MIYAVSDLHGCYKKFLGMLELIGFSDRDTMYVLGDVVDRGKDGIKLLLDLMERKNVIVLRGNHDHSAYLMLKHFGMSVDSYDTESLLEAFRLWVSDGGYATYKEFKKLKSADRRKVISFLMSLPFYREITVNGRSFFLSHTMPEKEKMDSFEDCRMNDFLLGEIEYEKVYDSKRFFVTGHTPTGFIDREYTGKIWQKNNHIAVDCGAVFGQPLGCVCLDNLEEFYYND